MGATVFINRDFEGLKIVVRGEQRSRDPQGNPTKSKGKYAQFENGRLRTEDKDTIDAVREYMKKHAGEIVEIDEETERKRAEHMKKAREEFDKKIAEVQDQPVPKQNPKQDGKQGVAG